MAARRASSRARARASTINDSPARHRRLVVEPLSHLSRLKDRAARAEKSRIRMGAAAARGRAVQAHCKDSHLVYAPLLLTSTKEVASS